MSGTWPGWWCAILGKVGKISGGFWGGIVMMECLKNVGMGLRQGIRLKGISVWEGRGLLRGWLTFRGWLVAVVWEVS